jgi:hypothetical protein
MLQQIDGLVPKYSHMPMPSANETDKCIGIEAIRTFFWLSGSDATNLVGRAGKFALEPRSILP